MKPCSVASSVERFLSAIHDREAAESPHAALALALAREIDDPGNSATSKAACAGRLLRALEWLSARAPEAPDAAAAILAKRDG